MLTEVEGAEVLPLKLAVVNPAARLGMSIPPVGRSLVKKFAMANAPPCPSSSYSFDSVRSAKSKVLGTEKLAPGEDLVDEVDCARLWKAVIGGAGV